MTGHGPMVALDLSETAAHSLAEAVANRDTAAASTALGNLAAATDDRIAIAALRQATRFVSVCVIGRTLGVILPVQSIFE